MILHSETAYDKVKNINKYGDENCLAIDNLLCTAEILDSIIFTI